MSIKKSLSLLVEGGSAAWTAFRAATWQGTWCPGVRPRLQCSSSISRPWISRRSSQPSTSRSGLADLPFLTCHWAERYAGVTSRSPLHASAPVCTSTPLLLSIPARLQCSSSISRPWVSRTSSQPSTSRSRLFFLPLHLLLHVCFPTPCSVASGNLVESGPLRAVHSSHYK